MLPEEIAGGIRWSAVARVGIEAGIRQSRPPQLVAVTVVAGDTMVPGDQDAIHANGNRRLQSLVVRGPPDRPERIAP